MRRHDIPRLDVDDRAGGEFEAVAIRSDRDALRVDVDHAFAPAMARFSHATKPSTAPT